MKKEKVNCTNIFKNNEINRLKEAFNKKWMELINESEKNKLISEKYLATKIIFTK